MEDRTVFQPSAAGSVTPGTRLNGIYEIEKLFAQGGMGEVYRGFNIQTRHQVAIKMIRAEYSNDPEIFNLFRREALILANLTHEAIVRYFVFSVDPDLGRAYLAMEFVDGPSLTKRLASSALPLDEVKVLQRRLASALETAHEHGIIHRDISPDNIILPDSDVGRAKIVDFGIARSVEPTEVSIIGGRFAGKYNFASPEQFGLAGGEVTFKSDIYSLGLVLAAALRGRPIDMSGTEVEAIAKRSVVPDLSDIDPAIRPLIQAMLQPLPANRPPSMAAVANWEGIRRPGLVLPRAAGRAKAVHEPAGGRTAAFLGAVIALASIGGATYAFRDDLARWGQSVIGPTAPPSRAKLTPVSEPQPRPTTLPPLGPPETKPAEERSAATASPSPTPAPPVAPQTSAPPPAIPEAQGENAPPTPEVQTPPEPPKPTKPQLVTAEALIDALPPRAAQGAVDLPPATVGSPYRQELPAFQDPGGKGLSLSAAGLPEGMTFSDLGNGRGKIEGAPARAGNASVEIVAANHNGRTAHMLASIAIANRPPALESHKSPAPVSPPPLPQRTELATPASTAPPHPALAPRAQEEPPANAPIARLETPAAPERVAALAATEGVEFSTDLPRFRAGANIAGLILRAEPDPPPGLVFADLGFGASRLSGTPTRSGPYAFSVVATDPAGQSGRMIVKLLVSPAETTKPPAAPPQPPAASAPITPPPAALSQPPVASQPPAEQKIARLSPEEKGRALVDTFDGGDCFFVDSPPGETEAHRYQAVGADLAPFRRFDDAYKSEVGVEAKLTVALIAREECPAIDLIRLGTDDREARPRIELANYTVGRGKPLAGTISNLFGRRLYLLLVDNEGVAYRLDAKPQPGGDAAAFSVPLTPDANSATSMQVLLAFASLKPIPALESLRQAPLKPMIGRLIDAARGASASVAGDYFRFSN